MENKSNKRQIKTAQISRRDHFYSDISTMHYLPFFGNDIYAVRTPAPFGGSKKGERVKPPQNRLMYVRLFDEESLRIRPIEFVQPTIERLANEYKNDAIITDILNNYPEANTDYAKYRVLSAFSKVSELKSSSSEFARLQNYIKGSSTKDYIQEKQVLQETLQEAKQHSKRARSGQTKLTSD